MIKKKFIKSRQVYKVTFSLPKNEQPSDLDISSMHLVGDFNDWNHTATRMEPNSKGMYRETLELEPGQDYQFRYLVNGEVWLNDWQADAYLPNEYGEENSVVQCPVD